MLPFAPLMMIAFVAAVVAVIVFLCAGWVAAGQPLILQLETRPSTSCRNVLPAGISTKRSTRSASEFFVIERCALLTSSISTLLKQSLDLEHLRADRSRDDFGQEPISAMIRILGHA